MNVWVKAIAFVATSHVVRCVAEYAYFVQCAGFWTSIFSWNSPMCQGLRWVADSTMAKAAGAITGHATKLLGIGGF